MTISKFTSMSFGKYQLIFGDTLIKMSDFKLIYFSKLNQLKL
jgi:hypothetical protein